MQVICLILLYSFCKLKLVNAILKLSFYNLILLKGMNFMAVDYSIIGERIKCARKACNMTQDNLSEQMGVSIAFLSRIERGSSQINLKRLSQICEILGISEGDILNGSSKKSSKYLDVEFANLLKDCSPEQQKLIYDIAKVIAKKD